jgi:hypothetical protein
VIAGQALGFCALLLGAFGCGALVVWVGDCWNRVRLERDLLEEQQRAADLRTKLAQATRPPTAKCVPGIPRDIAPDILEAYRKVNDILAAAPGGVSSIELDPELWHKLNVYDYELARLLRIPPPDPGARRHGITPHGLVEIVRRADS